MDEKAVKYYAVHTNVREVEAVKGNEVSLRGVLQGKPWEEFELGAKGNLAPTGQVGEFIANESLPSPGYGLSFEYSDLPDDWARDIVKNLKEEFGIADEPKKDDPEP